MQGAIQVLSFTFTFFTFIKLIQIFIYDKNQTKLQNQMLAMTVHDGKLQFCE